MGEAARSPLAIAPTASTASSPLESELKELISLTRQRRGLVADSDIDEGKLARLDTLLQQSMGALRRQSDRLPASIAGELSALDTDWQVLESARPDSQSTPFARFDQHSQFIDSLLVVLSQVRDAGL